MVLPQRCQPKPSSVHELVFKHERAIRNMITKRSGAAVLRRTSVEDLYQETIAEACASADRFEFLGDGQFVLWIGTIARRVIARSLRDPDVGGQTIPIRRAGSTGAGVPEAALLAPDRTPSSIMARVDNRAALAEGMRRLPEHYRRVLTLYVVEQRSLTEVAEALKRSKGATCRLMARSLRALRLAIAVQETRKTGGTPGLGSSLLPDLPAFEVRAV